MSSNAIPTIHTVTPGTRPVLAVLRLPASAPAASNDRPDHDTDPGDSSGEAGASPPLTAAVSRLNQHLARSRTDLQFKLDEAAGRVVVSIIDSDSGRVLRQMPSEEALRIARYLEGEGPGLLSRQA